ncbi:MAG TPA: hypothetical protein VGO62_03815 [Myxococcota bacterium]
MARIILVASFLSAVCALSSLGCAPSVDGGWSGDSTCGNSTFPIDAIFNENGNKELEGDVFVEGGTFFGPVITKGTVQDGERHDDGSYAGDLNTNTDSKPELHFSFSFDASNSDIIKGDVDLLDGDGKTTQTCAMHMDRVSQND